jgi:hypothetical protein
MKTSTIAFALALSVQSMTSSRAADEQKTLTPQQQKMSDCSAQAKAKALKGDERTTFMSDCLKGDNPTATSQQQKMKDCNKQATGKKGDERKAFMKHCLSGSAS